MAKLTEARELEALFAAGLADLPEACDLFQRLARSHGGATAEALREFEHAILHTEWAPPSAAWKTVRERAERIIKNTAVSPEQVAKMLQEAGCRSEIPASKMALVCSWIAVERLGAKEFKAADRTLRRRWRQPAYSIAAARRELRATIELADSRGDHRAGDYRRLLAALDQAPDLAPPGAEASFGWHDAARQLWAVFQESDPGAGSSRHGPAARFIRLALKRAGFGAMVTVAAIELALARSRKP